VQLPRFIYGREAAAYAGLSYPYWKELQAKGKTPALGARRRSGSKIPYTREGIDYWLLHRWDKATTGKGRAA
jgi:hypothetical protein